MTAHNSPCGLDCFCKLANSLLHGQLCRLQGAALVVRPLSNVCAAQLPFEGPGAAAALAALGYGEAVLLTPYNRFPYFMLRALPGRGPATQLPSRELQAVLGAHALHPAPAGDAGAAALGPTLGSSDQAGRQPARAAAVRSACADAPAPQGPACSAASGLAGDSPRAGDGAQLPLAGDGDAATAAGAHSGGAAPSATFASYFRCSLHVVC